MSSTHWRVAARVCGAGAVLYIAGCLLLGVWLAEFALKTVRSGIDAADTRRAQATVQPLGAQVRDVAIAARDGAMLRGWLFTPAQPNGHAVIALHGVWDNRKAMRAFAEVLLKEGYAVLTPDARAHGASGGDLATYGVLERDDIARWTGWLRERSPGCVHAFGSSMGAAQLLQTVDRPGLLCSVAVESSFSTFREVAYDRVGQGLGVGDWLGRTLLRPAVEIGLIAARVRYGIDLAHADPAGHLRRAQTPVLVIHGLADTNIPPRHARRLIEVGNPSRVTLWLVERGRHATAWTAEPTRFPARILAFFRAHQKTLTAA